MIEARFQSNKVHLSKIQGIAAMVVHTILQTDRQRPQFVLASRLAAKAFNNGSTFFPRICPPPCHHVPAKTFY
jgi:hypothetical protein